jgi:DNA mismatch endonuclease (patch repair protein)
MAAVKGKGNKTTERRVRSALVRAAINGWNMHPKEITGRPDFYFPREKLAVFVDGCFWHGCAGCGHIPVTNTAFWQAKIERNRKRDVQTTETLIAKGIIVLRFWEHEVQNDVRSCLVRVKTARKGRRRA